MMRSCYANSLLCLHGVNKHVGFEKAQCTRRGFIADIFVFYDAKGWIYKICRLSLTMSMHRAMEPLWIIKETGISLVKDRTTLLSTRLERH